jgi:hypothetical protein
MRWKLPSGRSDGARRDGTAKYLAAGYVLIAMNAAWLWAGDRGQPATLPSILRETHSLAASDTPTVAVFFSARDCAAVIESLSQLNGAGAAEHIRVVGVMGAEREDGPDLVDRVRKGAGLRFALVQAPARDVARTTAALGYGNAPLAVVLDRELRVRSVVPLGSDNDRRALRRLLAGVAPHPTLPPAS